MPPPEGFTRNFIVMSVCDGWRPLQLREHPAGLGAVLPVVVDTEALRCREVFRFVRAGEDLDEALEGQEAVPLGHFEGFYLFVDLPPEAPDDARRVSHPALLEEREETLKNEVAPPDNGV